MHPLLIVVLAGLCSPTLAWWPTSLSLFSRDDEATTTITVSTSVKHQTVEGWGFAEAFQAAAQIQSLPSKTRKQVLDLLFSPTLGLGANILRVGIGSSETAAGNNMVSILPGPWDLNVTADDFKPDYVWDGKDGGQVWLAQQAMTYGADTFFASAWSAPGFMKTNKTDIWGGYLCGTTGNDCDTGDWRQVYADYLVKYVQYYAAAGVPITHLGFLNEPDLREPYPSMLSTGQQAADAIKIITPTFRDANLTTKITCCDGSGYYAQEIMMSGLTPVFSLLDTIVVHPYSTPLTGVLTTKKTIWQGEYSDQKSTWDPLWYNTTTGTTPGSKGDGLSWALYIQSAFTQANVSAYLYWIGAQFAFYNTVLVQINGNSVVLPKRYYAFLQFSRFVRPGAVRVGTSSSTTGVTSSAFVNANGTIAVQVVNSSANNLTVSVKGLAGDSVVAYLSDEDNDLSVVAADIGVLGTNIINSTIPARGMMSFLV